MVSDMHTERQHLNGTHDSDGVPSQPVALGVIAESIPAELTALRQWVGWRWELRDGKWTKPLHQPRNIDAYAKSTEPRTWGTFDEAIAVYRAGRAAGVGFVLTADDPYVAIDLDHVRDADAGLVEPWAMTVVQSLNTYAEASPSATGLRAIGRGSLPPGRRKRGQVEAYSTERYVTLTGHVLDGFGTIEKRTAEIAAFHAEYLADKLKPEHRRSESAPVTLDDAALLDRARLARNGAEFDRLWRGVFTGDQSTADAKLLSMLAFWTGGDMERMRSLFSLSALGQREKWIERPDYQDRSLLFVLNNLSEVYTPRPRNAARRGHRPVQVRVEVSL